MNGNKITVGIADMKLAKGSGILITYALGSCKIGRASCRERV